MRVSSILSSIAVGIFFIFGSFCAQADSTTTTTVVEKRVIVTPAPKAVCSTVAGHWDGDVWVDTHNICKYENRAEGVAWIADYWSCTAYTADGNCNSWVLVPGHWVKTLP
jgi:hypothetical protein